MIHTCTHPLSLNPDSFGLSDIPFQEAAETTTIYTVDTYRWTKYDRWFDFVSTHQPASPVVMKAGLSFLSDSLLTSSAGGSVSRSFALPTNYLVVSVFPPHPNQKSIWDNHVSYLLFFMSAYSMRVMYIVCNDSTPIGGKTYKLLHGGRVRAVPRPLTLLARRAYIFL